MSQLNYTKLAAALQRQQKKENNREKKKSKPRKIAPVHDSHDQRKEGIYNQRKHDIAEPLNTTAVSVDVKTPAPTTALFPTHVISPSLQLPKTAVEMRSFAQKLVGGRTKEGISLKDAMKSMGVRLRPVDFVLAYTITQSSSAATALAFAQRLRPSDSGEFTACAELFDLYKAHGADILYHIAITGAAPTSNVDFAAAYDPANNGSYSSIAAVLPAAQHTYVNLAFDANAVGAGWPLATTRSGHWLHKMKFPMQPVQDPTGANSINTGDWTDTGDTGVDYGYWKGYVTAAGTSQIVNIAAHILLKVTFKMRS